MIFQHFVSAVTLEPLHLRCWNFACAPILNYSKENFFFVKNIFAKKSFFQHFFAKKYFFSTFFSKWFQKWSHKIWSRYVEKRARYSQKSEIGARPPSWITKKPPGRFWTKVAISFLGTPRYLYTKNQLYIIYVDPKC